MNFLYRYMNYIYQAMLKERNNARQAFMAQAKGAIYLDCGCHAGDHTKIMAEQLGSTDIFGLEFNQRMSHRALEKGIRVSVTDLNCPFPFKSESVDAITALDVVEHLIETRTFISELYRVLRPGGFIIIDTPNLASWHNVFALLIGLQPFSGPHVASMSEADVEVIQEMRGDIFRALNSLGYNEEAGRHKMYRHLVVLTYRTLMNELKRVGFNIEHALVFGYYPFPPPLARFIGKLDPWHAHHMLIKAYK